MVAKLSKEDWFSRLSHSVLVIITTSLPGHIRGVIRGNLLITNIYEKYIYD